MKSRASSAMVVLVLAAVAGNCSSNERSRAVAGRTTVETIGLQFQRLGTASLEGQQARKEPFFRQPWKATFEAAVDGELLARSEEEAQAGRSLSTRFPAKADGPLRVTVAGEVWLHERLVGAASSALAEVVDGRVVYVSAKRGVDRVFEVTAQRVEEYLHLGDELAAAELAWDVETGPGIADLIVDGSGFGLVAVDAAGTPVLKAPQPQGVDARGEAVLGRLVATRTGDHRFQLRVELLAGSRTFPVLLDPSWVSTGSMGTSHWQHTATRLLSGRVLVAGGGGAPSAELYDQNTRTWSATGSLISLRYQHATVLLPNGKVLVMGGWTGGGTYLATAELYDPATGLWSATGSMSIVRHEHTATLLPNGKVLVAGGESSGVQVASAELYDPATGLWTATGSMAFGRYYHAATLLPNGKVLVAAGFRSPGGGLVTAELYDPALGTWTVTGSLAAARFSYKQTAVLLTNGKVLLAGGEVIPWPTPSLASAELYDPAAGTWSATGAMAAGRGQFPSVLLTSGKVLVVAGYGGGSSFPATAELYDPASGTWSGAGALATPRRGGSATLLLNGTVLVAGGYDVSFLASAELYLLSLTEPCTLSADCASGFCADGVCCSTACAGGCDVCNVSAGTCTNIVAGSTGNPSCAPYFCSGAASCPGSCTIDTQCVAGNYCNGTVCLPKKVLGLTCAAANQCLSAHCVDGVCCNTSCVGSCDACNLATALGTCTNAPAGSAGSPSCAPYVCSGAAVSCPVSCTVDAQCAAGQYCDGSTCVPKKTPGATCAAASECVSGNCVDGVCCNTACAGACDACNLAASVGTCTNTPSGSPGGPSCAPYVCSGAATSCPTSCTNDAQCVAGRYCDGSVCVPTKGVGVICATANECASGNCVDGVCCNTACAGACDACDLAASVGSCTNTPAGSPGNPSCAPLVCSGSSANCPGGCLTDADCVAGQYCEGSSCVPKRVLGLACAAANVCVGGNCVDGVCCDTACDGACDACNLAGTVGTCSDAPAGSPGSPACAPYLCAGDSATCPTSCVVDAQCTGGTKCVAGACAALLPNGSACLSNGQCLSALCVDGFCCNSACAGTCEVCNAAGKEGQCVFAPVATQGTPSCTPYICPGDSAECPSGCETDSACELGKVCAEGQCVATPDAGSGLRSYPGWSCGCQSGAPGAPELLLLALGFFRWRRTRTQFARSRHPGAGS